MGQNSSQGLQSRHQLRNWLFRDKDPNVLTNCLTHQQVHRHYIRILVKDLARETALFSTRINNPQPYICRLLYFHPVSVEAKQSYDHQKDFREMFIYTDRFLHLRDWSRQKIILALHGLRRLISVHGPIRISEHMLCENESGEIKVWISENPVNNHPDSKYMSEEQSMGDFAALLTKKNMTLANLLIGCNTLKEASQKLSRLQREDSSPYQNYSHRASGSGEILKRKMDKEKSNMALYKNVFGDIHDSVKTKPQIPTPKHSIKMFDHYPQSSFLPKEDESLTPTAHSTNLSRYREFVHTNKSGTPNQEKVHNKSIPKNIHASEAYLLGRRREEEVKANFRPSKINQNSIEGSQKGKELLSFTSSNVKSHSPTKPFNFVHRFETATTLSPTLNHFNSPKTRADPVWKSNESSNLNISNIYDQRQGQPQAFKEEKIKANGYDITIINNNVNNYISNITHNHVIKPEKTPSEQVHQFRTQTKTNQQNIHSSNQFPKKNKEKRYDVPVFIQQKKKAGEQMLPPQQPFVVKSKSNYNLNRKYTVSSNPQEVSYESPQISSQKKIQVSFDMNGKQRKQKVFHFNKNQDPMLSSHKTITNSYPISPNPSQHFTSFQRASNNSFEFTAPLRTKTTEFHQKGREAKHDEPQHKSFTQNQLEKKTYLHKSQQKEWEDNNEVSLKKLERQESGCATTTTLEEPKQEQNKIEFKRQLRNQFKFLLSADPKQKEEDNTEAHPPPQKAEKQQSKCDIKQGNLKQKIMRKQIVFAELKKQAFDLLQ